MDGVVTDARTNTLKAYDTIAPLYAEYSCRYRDYLHAVDQLVIDRLSPGTRLLDLGSGDGLSVKQIMDAMVRVTGHEFTPVISARRPGLSRTVKIARSSPLGMYPPSRGIIASSPVSPAVIMICIPFTRNMPSSSL